MATRENRKRSVENKRGQKKRREREREREREKKAWSEEAKLLRSKSIRGS